MWKRMPLLCAWAHYGLIYSFSVAVYNSHDLLVEIGCGTMLRRLNRPLIFWGVSSLWLYNRIFILPMSVVAAPVVTGVAQGITPYLTQLSRRNVLFWFQIFFSSLLPIFVDFFCAFLKKMIRASFSGLGPVTWPWTLLGGAFCSQVNSDWICTCSWRLLLSWPHGQIKLWLVTSLPVSDPYI